MKRCTRCIYPDTKPDLHFDAEGVCSACRSYDKRAMIDWDARKKELVRLLETHGKHGREFDCIVPSSGGKDSHWQVLTLLKLGARPLVVTATTCHLTPIGRANIDNLSRYATTIEITPNRTVRAKLNRLGLQLVGDISWPEHVSIFTTPFRVAVDLGIPLIFYGENPQEAYGGPPGTDGAKEMTRRWVSEFGGFLGLRPQDMVGQDGITERDMVGYMPPNEEAIDIRAIQAHFLGTYFSWDSHANAIKAMDAGMRAFLPCSANWWIAENLDNAQTGIHDHMMWRKYGYGRACAQLSVDIRARRINRPTALNVLQNIDGLFPNMYAGVPVTEILKRIDVTREELTRIMDSFTNWQIMRRTGHPETGRPVLIE